MRYERALAIARRHEQLTELIRAGNFSSPELARKLKVSEQTIYRDVDSLKERGFAIQAVRLAKGWAYKLHGEPEPVSSGRGSSR
ncbi:MAG TPA: helix-turn-helix domain-containing protein [Gemmataceae bacterium]|jgi:DeoR/GlpR family transcriptional regulator of sugar metabolism|nr:helix-turn-helix domain-containing protein [Gemmataceae bacterium]